MTFGGYAGKILRVDLDKGRTESESLDESLLRDFIGGSGVGAKILYEETGAETDPLSGDNPLIFMVGPLTATRVPGTGRHTVITKSPLTGIFAENNVGGYWGVALKQAGFDGIIFKGKAKSPTYLWVHDGEVELKDAGYLWGKNTKESDELLKKETHAKAVTAVIGPAGERMVKISGIVHEGGDARMAARCGVGAVMGSKNLKAVVVYGSGEAPIAEPEKLRVSIKEGRGIIREAAGPWGKLGTSGGILNYEKLGNFPHQNWLLSDWGEEEATRITGQTMADTILTGRYACAHCPIACGREVSVKEGPFAPIEGKGPEYETLGVMGGLCLVDNLEAVAKASQLCDLYGLDTISTGGLVAFAIEAYQKGLITKKDTGGLELKWASPESLVGLTEKIGKGEDIGKLLGEGVTKASEAIGKNAAEFAVEIKGLEFPAHDPRCFYSVALSYATSNRGACHLAGWSHPYEMSLSQPDIGIPEPQERHQLEGKAEFTAKLQNLMCMFDVLVLCKFAQIGGGLKVHHMVNWLNLVSGRNMGVEEFMKTGERIFNLKRLYNARCGISRKDDSLPPRILTVKRRGGKLPPLGELLSDYYQYRGWSEEGIPLPAKLAELDLEP